MLSCRVVVVPFMRRRREGVHWTPSHRRRMPRRYDAQVSPISFPFPTQQVGFRTSFRITLGNDGFTRSAS